MTRENEQAVSVYDKIAESYAKTFSEPPEYINEFLTLIPRGGKVLDAGCGPGFGAAHIARNGFEVTAKTIKKAGRGSRTPLFRCLHLP